MAGGLLRPDTHDPQCYIDVGAVGAERTDATRIISKNGGAQGCGLLRGGVTMGRARVWPREVRQPSDHAPVVVTLAE